MWLLTCLLIACAAIASLPQWLVSADGVNSSSDQFQIYVEMFLSAQRQSAGIRRLQFRILKFAPLVANQHPFALGASKAREACWRSPEKGGRIGLITVNNAELHLSYDENHDSSLQETIGIGAQTGQLDNRPDKPTPSPQRSDVGPLMSVFAFLSRTHIRIDGPWTSTSWESKAIDVEAVLNQYTDGTKEWALDASHSS